MSISFSVDARTATVTSASGRIVSVELDEVDIDELIAAVGHPKLLDAIGRKDVIEHFGIIEEPELKDD